MAPTHFVAFYSTVGHAHVHAHVQEIKIDSDRNEIKLYKRATFTKEQLDAVRFP